MLDLCRHDVLSRGTRRNPKNCEIVCLRSAACENNLAPPRGDDCCDLIPGVLHRGPRPRPIVVRATALVAELDRKMVMHQLDHPRIGRCRSRTIEIDRALRTHETGWASGNFVRSRAAKSPLSGTLVKNSACVLRRLYPGRLLGSCKYRPTSASSNA